MKTYIVKTNFMTKLQGQSFLAAGWSFALKRLTFLLPDVCNLFGNHEGQQYLFMPLTPRDCLVVLPIPVDEPRIVPHYTKATESMVKDISYILYSAARNEFLSASTARLHLNTEAPATVMQRIILALTKITS